MKLLLIILWGIAGICVLVSGKPSMLAYGCVWFCLMLEYVEGYIKDRKGN